MNEGRILMLDLLDILKKYSDKNNPLTQTKIIELLEQTYGYRNVRRQTIQSNIERMVDHYEFEDRLIRLAAEDDYFERDIEEMAEPNRRITNIYFEHKLTDSELILIIDSLLFSNQIPVSERKLLIEKLEGLASKHFNSRMGNIASLAGANQEDQTLFQTIQEIDKAMTESKKIAFNYAGYETKGNKITLEPRKNNQGIEREYIINPYYMAASNGRYYLICNNDAYDNLSIYRMDRILNVQTLENRRKPTKEVKGIGPNFKLNDYMQENIYMFGGEAEYVRLRVQKICLDEFIDWFKLNDINVLDTTEDHLVVRVKSNKMAMRRWALRYSLYAQVLEPEDLAGEIKADLKKALENYN